MRKVNKTVTILLAFLIFSSSCKDFLNVVPDDVPTIDHAFSNRKEAEKYLYGCYSFSPTYLDVAGNPALTGGGEIWLIPKIYSIGDWILAPWRIAKGEQNTNEPLANFWNSNQYASSTSRDRNIFTGIRDCNIFLEEIDKPFDLSEWERNKWIAEVKFVKAHLYFWLLRMYGPVPIIKENLPLGASPDKVMVYRDPVDDVVEHIVQLLDESVKDLPDDSELIPQDYGRATKAIALSLKAQVLIYAASPLFNGNPDYFDFVDNRGVRLFPQEFKIEKWQRAVDALKSAIDTCHFYGYNLYDYRTSAFASTLKDSTIFAVQTRAATTERWNKEIIWGDAGSVSNDLQLLCHPAFTPHISNLRTCYAPPLHIIEQFYTRNGIPIEEDPEWDDIDKFGLKAGDEIHKNYIKKDYTTINLHFNREPRFYGSISFDGGLFHGNGRLIDESKFYHTEFIYGGSGIYQPDRHSETGYLVKKLISLMTSASETSSTFSSYRYAFPIIRLADLYLMYAEALNEVKSSPDGQVYEYIDYVRKRSGLEGVIDSWSKYSKFPGKPLTQEGMREIVRQERLNELAFEGPRFWDMRRWKLAEQDMNRTIRGLNIYEDTPEEFYKVQTIFNTSFTLKDYLWPISISELIKNKNLVQNPGW